MLFNSFNFIFIFLPIIIFSVTKLRGNVLLFFVTASSLYFYGSHGHLWFIFPMIFTTTLDFYLARWMNQYEGSKRKSILWLSLISNLSLLFVFKYANFFLTITPESFSNHAPDWVRKIVLPAGISFYTFQTISYMIDVYYKRVIPEKNYWLFSSFVSFFPHLVAGPLTRHNQLIPSLINIAENKIKPRWREGILLFSLGLGKKILIADRIAEIIDPMLLNYSTFSSVEAWICLIGYTLQIYFDFSGYSDMAIGLGRLFNIELPQNFNAPYQSNSFIEFWKRWHITLGAWLRDYLYIPLGGNKAGVFGHHGNLLTTMLLGGLWHGASWNFIIWGGYHGILLILNHKFIDTWEQLPNQIKRSIVFLLVSIGWVIFRADSPAMIILWIKKLIPTNVNDIISISVSQINIPVILLLVFGIFITQWVKVPASIPNRFSEWRNKELCFTALVFTFSILFFNHTSKFLYFQF